MERGEWDRKKFSLKYTTKIFLCQVLSIDRFEPNVAKKSRMSGESGQVAGAECSEKIAYEPNVARKSRMRKNWFRDNWSKKRMGSVRTFFPKPYKLISFRADASGRGPSRGLVMTNS
jgi:hypothetical protein